MMNLDLLVCKAYRDFLFIPRNISDYKDGDYDLQQNLGFHQQKSQNQKESFSNAISNLYHAAKEFV